VELIRVFQVLCSSLTMPLDRGLACMIAVAFTEFLMVFLWQNFLLIFMVQVVLFVFMFLDFEVFFPQRLEPSTECN